MMNRGSILFVMPEVSQIAKYIESCMGSATRKVSSFAFGDTATLFTSPTNSILYCILGQENTDAARS